MTAEALFEWKLNGRRHLLALLLIQKKFERKEITLHKKIKIEKRIRAMWKHSHFEKNPFIQENLMLRKVAESFLE